MSRSVATPFGAQKLGCTGDESEPKDAALPPTRATSLRVTESVEMATDTEMGGTKRSSAKPKLLSDAADFGRFYPPPAKRCKLMDEGGEEPTAEMLSMEAIIVNLERRPDRMEGCSERIRLNCPWLQHTRFEATDGRQTRVGLDEVVMSWNTASNVVYQRKRAIRKGWDDLDSYEVRDLELSPGERGCSSSHINAWKHCLERAGDTDRPLMVLEDDAAPTAAFTSTLRRALAAKPADADVLYLGYSQAAEWRQDLSENLAECEYVWTTVGYIIWPAAARLFLSRLPINGPVDNWMAGLCAAGDIKAYAVRPKIVLQADAWNVNSDVAHSDEHYWGPSSDIHHSDALYGPPYNSDTSDPGASPLNGIARLPADRSNTIWADLDEDSEESEDSCGDAA